MQNSKVLMTSFSLQHNSHSDFHSPNSEMKWTPLHLACVTRELSIDHQQHQQPANASYLEIHSPNRKHSIILRLNTNTFDKWYGSLLSAIEAAAQESMIRANFALQFRVTRMGWLTQLVEKSSSYSSETSFDSGMSADNASSCAHQSAFVAQTEDHLMMWDLAPWTIKDWAHPRDKIKLVQMRVLKSHSEAARKGSSPLRISLRYGGDHGILCYAFLAAGKSDHTAWLSSMIQGTLYASKNLGYLKVNCIWNETDCVLCVYVDRGFSLVNAATGVEIWHRPYQSLESSNDDGARLLWLQFRGEEEQAFNLQQANPKVVVFVLHNFLSTKLQLLGKS